jgi:hypothetical protein
LIILAIGPTVFNRYVAALDITTLAQTSVKGGKLVPKKVNRFATEESDHRRWRLLRASHHRPRRSAADTAALRQLLSACLRAAGGLRSD